MTEKEKIRIQTSETFLLSAILALSGGFQDAYTYNVRNKVFSNAQTGNVVLMSQHLMIGEWMKGLSYLFPILSFALGVLVAERIGHRYKKAKRIHWRQIVVAIEIIILFCPVRYRASGTKETDSFRDISARARVSWLFGVVSFQLQYQNGTSAFDFRLFGIPIMKLIQKFRNRSHPAEKKPQNGHTDSLPANTEKSTNSTDFKDVSTADSCRSTNEASDLTEETVASERDTDLEYARTKIGHLFYRLGIFFRNLWNRLSRLWQKICRIPSSVENFTLTIQNICAKIESYQKFLEHPRTKAAFSLIKDRFFRLLRHVFPTRIQGTLTFGSSDPSVTGAVLAILGMTIPLHKNCIAVTPLFEDRNVILGNIQIKGRIYGVVLLKTALELYFNKNIKYIIRRWKHK